MRKKLYALVAACMFALLIVNSAFATATYNMSGVSSSFTDQIQNAVTTALPIAGPILALFVGWKVLKRLVKA